MDLTSFGVFSGAVGSVVTLGLQSLINWLRKPVLIFDDRKKGCCVASGDGKYFYARIYIRNDGCTEAKNAQVLITEIEGSESETLNLRWAHSDENGIKSDIPSGVGRYIDICRTPRPSGGETTLFLDSPKHKTSLPNGSNRFVLYATAENAKTERRVVVVVSKGVFGDLAVRIRRI